MKNDAGTPIDESSMGASSTHSGAGASVSGGVNLTNMSAVLPPGPSMPNSTNGALTSVSANEADHKPVLQSPINFASESIVRSRGLFILPVYELIFFTGTCE